jgi:hypothetical protein
VIVDGLQCAGLCKILEPVGLEAAVDKANSELSRFEVEFGKLSDADFQAVCALINAHLMVATRHVYSIKQHETDLVRYACFFRKLPKRPFRHASSNILPVPISNIPTYPCGAAFFIRRRRRTGDEAFAPIGFPSAWEIPRQHFMAMLRDDQSCPKITLENIHANPNYINAHFTSTVKSQLVDMVCQRETNPSVWRLSLKRKGDVLAKQFGLERIPDMIMRDLDRILAGRHRPCDVSDGGDSKRPSPPRE